MSIAPLTVVTCLSDVGDRGYCRYLRPSCLCHDLRLVTLHVRSGWPSHRAKDELLRLYLRRLPSSAVVLFTDAYDTALLAPAEAILAKYLGFGAPIVCTAERNCWPDESLSKYFPASPTAFRFLNTGGFIGTAGALRDLIHETQRLRSAERSHPPDGDAPRAETMRADRYPWSNQYLWHLTYLRDPSRIALDYYTALFLSLGTDLETRRREVMPGTTAIETSPLYRSERERIARECEVVDGRIVHRDTCQSPIQLHFNGSIPKRVIFDGLLDVAMPWMPTRTA
jgi:hypothetical protein